MVTSCHEHAQRTPKYRLPMSVICWVKKPVTDFRRSCVCNRRLKVRVRDDYYVKINGAY